MTVGHATVERAGAASLDPLHGDHLLRDLPGLNAASDTASLAGVLRRLMPAPGRVEVFSVVECLAAMRDLGMVLGSLKRHGVEPLSVAEGLEQVLQMLARRTDMIPRDTVHHYTEWNPVGCRQRMYTGDPQETVLIDAVRLALPRLRDAVERCAALRDTAADDESFAPIAEALAGDLRGFDEAITTVVAQVRPEFFARGLRPYFEEVAIGGRTYLGPAAAHVPLFLVDLVVWASEDPGPAYAEFLDESREHTLPEWRSLSVAWQGSPSLVTTVGRALAAAPASSPPDSLRRSATALGLVLRALVRFRSKHIGMARRSYRAEVGLYRAGSGGGTVELLHEILDLTRRNNRLVAATPSRRSRQVSGDGARRPDHGQG